MVIEFTGNVELSTIMPAEHGYTDSDSEQAEACLAIGL